jgi:hypothetical protein
VAAAVAKDMGEEEQLTKVEEKIGSQQGEVLKINRCSANILLMPLVIMPAACMVISPTIVIPPPRIPANLMMEKRLVAYKKPSPAHTLFTPYTGRPSSCSKFWSQIDSTHTPARRC